MKRISLLGLLALVPAALNASPAAARGVLAVPLCAGDGAARTVNVPVGPQDVPGAEQPGCCAKGCQSGSARKRAKRCGDVDPAQ
ncbi:MAG TPA: hypothetical protein VN222_11385 [Novosphingobium sp.]|nr:hypothetical protein [Novosphingobium sp.]